MSNITKNRTPGPKGGDFVMLKSLREHGQLTEVDHLFPDDAKVSQEIILVVCSDSPHLADKVLHQTKFSKSVSLYSHGGGGYRFGVADPLKYGTLLDDLVKHVIHTVGTLGKQAVIVLMGHYPCQWAKDERISLAEKIILLQTACQRIQERVEFRLIEIKKAELIQQVKVYAFFHVNWSQRKNRTYQLIR